MAKIDREGYDVTGSDSLMVLRVMRWIVLQLLMKMELLVCVCMTDQSGLITVEQYEARS